MYQPILGRFLSRDPAVGAGQELLYGDTWIMNQIRRWRAASGYAFAMNNPQLGGSNEAHEEERPSNGSAKRRMVRIEATTTIACPGYGCQPGDCDFLLSLEARVQPDRSVGLARICFHQSPGEYVPPAPSDPTICQSWINRSINKTDHITVTLLDGTVCKFTEGTFPENAPWPPRRLPAECLTILTFTENDPAHPPGGPLKGGCYQTTDTVKSVSLDMTMEIGCFCKNCEGFADYDTLKLSGSAP